MMKISITLSFFILFSCTENSHRKIETLRKDGMVLMGKFIHDSIYDDTIRFFNLNGNLLSKKYFINGKQEGESIDYYSNGKPKIISYYADGIKNGYYSYFDSLSQRCLYTNFYYYGLPTGPVIFFDNSGNPKGYYFISLENKTLLRIDYHNWKGITDIYSSCINFTDNIQRTDTTREVAIFIYLMRPPKFSFNYSILKRNEKSKNSDLVEVKKIVSDNPFSQITLPVLPPNEMYVIGLNVFDSLLNKETVIYKDF